MAKSFSPPAGYSDAVVYENSIHAELKKARRLVKGGVSRHKLYDHIISRGARSLVYLD